MRRLILPPWPIMVGLGLLALAGLLVFEDQRRQGLYWYDVGEDYRYRFEGEEVERIPVRVTAEGFSLPQWSKEWRTALLHLSVTSDSAGRWFEPSLEARTAGGPPCGQFFERGAEGGRYVNLCLQSAIANPGDLVRLAGNHLRWAEQEAELLLFSAADPDRARILVLAPHPDDAEIGAFGLYAGRQSWVVSITTGSYGGDVYRNLVADAAERETLQASLRVWDSLEVPRWGGVPPERTLNLGYFTLALEPMYRNPDSVVPNPFSGTDDIARWRAWNSSSLLDGRPAISSWENLVGDLAHLLEQIRPDIVVSPHPVLDGSSDHEFTTVALLEALERIGDPPLHLFLYTVHHPRGHYFPAGPAGAAVTLPPWFDDATPFRSIYAHPLDQHQQIAKLFALDAMHDLRVAPEAVLLSGLMDGGDRLVGAVAGIWRDPARELSFFRRAVRPTELFFVYDTRDRERLQRLVE